MQIFWEKNAEKVSKSREIEGKDGGVVKRHDVMTSRRDDEGGEEDVMTSRR